MAITTLQAVRTAMCKRASDTRQDAAIHNLLAPADAIIKRYTKRDLEAMDYTEYHSGRGRRALILRQRPVAAPADVTRVCVDQGGYFGQGPNAFPVANDLVQGRGFVLNVDKDEGSESGILLRLSAPFTLYGRSGTLWGGPAVSVWPVGVGNILVTYTAGYDPIPDDLVEAGGLLVAWMLRTGPTGTGASALTSESLGAYSYSLAHPGPDDPAELGTVRQILTRYREVST